MRKINFAVDGFRSLEDINIELKPITLLFGANGSGKSSLIKAIKFFQENISTGLHLPNGINYKLNNTTDLGDFKSLNTNNQVGDEQSIVIGFGFSGSLEDFGFYREVLNEKLTKNKEEFNSSINMLGICKEGVGNYPGIESLDGLLKITDDGIKFMSAGNKFFDLKREVVDSNHDWVIGLGLTPNENPSIIFQNQIQKYEVTLNDEKSLEVDFDILPSDEEIVTNTENLNGELLEVIDIVNGEEVVSGFISREKSRKRKLEIIENNNELCQLFYRLGGDYKKHVRIKKKNLSFDRLFIQTLAFLTLIDEENNVLLSKEKFEEKYKLLFEFFLLLDLTEQLFPQNEFLWFQSTRTKPLSTYKKSFSKGFEEDYYNLLWMAEQPGTIPYSEESNLFEINKFLKGFSKKFGSHFDVKEIKFVDNQFVLTSTSGAEYNLSEASSGLQQILPFLLKAEEFEAADTVINPYYSKSIIIEQPELHLHPKLQAFIAEFIAVNIYSKKRKNFVIETHSEHLVRKLQVLIAKGKLNKEDVAVYYFDKQNGKTKIKEMEVEVNGFFKESWPAEFFDDSFNLSMELLTAKKN